MVSSHDIKAMVAEDFPVVYTTGGLSLATVVAVVSEEVRALVCG